MVETSSQPSLGEYFVREGYLTHAQLNSALERQRDSARSLGRILISMGLVSEDLWIAVLNKRFHYEALDLAAVEIDPAVLRRIPRAFAEKHHVVPVRLEGDDTLVIAMEDPSDIVVLDAIKSQIDLKVTACVARTGDIEGALEQYARVGSGVLSSGDVLQSESWVYKVLKNGAFPVLGLAPLVIFFLAVILDWWDVPDMLRSWYAQELLTYWDMLLYILLIWGMWTIVLFEINGLIFGVGRDEDED